MILMLIVRLQIFMIMVMIMKHLCSEIDDVHFMGAMSV